MEFVKKYWWALLLAPVVIYFLYKYATARQEVINSAARARQAKAEKSAIRKALEEDENLNGAEHAGAGTMDS